MQLYDGRILKGTTLITFKIDGVQAIKKDNGQVVSRNNKPLYGLDHMPYERAEIFINNFKDSISFVKTHSSPAIDLKYIYSLSPTIDIRLVTKVVEDVSVEEINTHFNSALLCGYEGLVLYNNERTYKVKKKETVDTIITMLTEGTGQFKDRLGAFVTPVGNIGTGFTREERKEFFNPLLIGAMVEVECMEITTDGKCRHPRFVRLRPDK